VELIEIAIVYYLIKLSFLLLNQTSAGFVASPWR